MVEFAEFIQLIFCMLILAHGVFIKSLQMMETANGA